jgi:hypothetical protein
VAGTPLRKNINDFAAGCRNFNTMLTLPWADRGPRVLPMSLFFDHKQTMNDRKTKFEALCQQFFDGYDGIKDTARAHMGGLYREEDYPSLEEVKNKFAFNVTYSPLPDAGDFRVDMANDDLKELQEQYERDYEARLAEAMAKPWQDLHAMMSGMSEKLTDTDADTKKRWHDTFLTNAQDMCALLTKLNVTKDPKLEEARRQLEVALMGVDIEGIKADPTVRADVKSKIDSIINKFSW